MGTTSERGGDVEGLVASFFRSTVVVGRPARALFRRGLGEAEWLDLLRRAPLNLRENLARTFVSARLASGRGVPLLLVEGWRRQVVEPTRGAPHHVTGSWMAGLLLAMLRRRGLAAPRVRVLRREVSRCTMEEVGAVLDAASPAEPSRVTGVAGKACPSRRRAARYFRLRGAGEARVVDCWRLLAEWRPLMSEQERALARALRRTPGERARDVLFEGANWLVHWLSQLEGHLLRPAVPLEIRLARRLRRNA